MQGVMSKNPESPLLAAARTLSDDLERFSALSGELSRLVINSDKTLQRARRSLLECSEHESKLAESLRGFALAMQEMQATQHRCMELASAATERVRQRQEQRAELQERLQQLSQKAREVNGPGLDLPESPGAASSDVLGPLQEIARRLELVIAEAAEVSELARADDWVDVERDTHALEQQLVAAKNRVQLGLRKLAQDAPS
jgi:DNA repair exonuclease SbcCD ATPase subunit